MQTLSDIIEPEDNGYRPPNIKYQTPGGFDLMDLMAFAEHGQPYEWFHKLRSQARLPGGSRRLKPMSRAFGR